MTNCTTHTEMKESGAGWLRQIPKNWNTRPLKYLFSIKKEIASELGHTILSVTQKGIKPKLMSEKGQFSFDYSKYQLVRVGDFVMNHMDLLTGWVDISNYNGVTSPDYRVFVNMKPDNYVSNYYNYIFQSCYSNRIFYGLGQGVSGFGRWRLPADMFLSFVLPIPTIDEQEIIASYLNAQCAKIDTIIEEAKASIEDYKEWKTSVIFEAVTKGLDPNARMKDSGVDIIGQIPVDWHTTRVRFLCSIMTGNQDTQNADQSGIYPFYVRSPIVERANVYTFEGESILMAGDGAGAGPVFHHVQGKYAIHQRVYCMHNFSGILPRYFYYFMSNLFSTEIDKGSAKSTVPSVRLPMLLNFNVCIPTAELQRQIIHKLDAITGDIDAVIDEKQALITDLETYKRSLIYEAVTGKRKVVCPS